MYDIELVAPTEMLNKEGYAKISMNFGVGEAELNLVLSANGTH